MKSRCAQLSDLATSVVVALVLALSGLAGLPVVAQQQPLPPLERGSVVSPILTIDSERVFLQSAFGKRVSARAEAEANALEDENARVASELELEEQALTDRRATLTPEEFRDLADAFDDKVQITRQRQAAKGRAINDALEAEREVFLQAAAPVLEQLMREAGAAVILERRSVFVSSSAVEITEEAIQLLDARLGSGD